MSVKHAATLVMGHDNMPCDPMKQVRQYQDYYILVREELVDYIIQLQRGAYVRLPSMYAVEAAMICIRNPVGLEVTP